METRAEHSPGPWSRLRYYNGDNKSLTVINANKETVATVRGWAGDPDHSEADAVLVARAPCMYAALDELVGEHDARSAEAMKEPGCGPIPDTGGIAWARTILERIAAEVPA